jgi:hypothetical protein
MATPATSRRPGLSPDSRAGGALTTAEAPARRRVPAAPPSTRPTPPCWADPDRWYVDISLGRPVAASRLRAAAAGCRQCQITCPANFARCAATPPKLCAARYVLAGKVVTVKGNRVDPEHYIKTSLRALKALPAGEPQ